MRDKLIRLTQTLIYSSPDTVRQKERSPVSSFRMTLDYQLTEVQQLVSGTFLFSDAGWELNGGWVVCRWFDARKIVLSSHLSRCLSCFLNLLHTVIAPSDLREGYEFDAQIAGQTFKAVVVSVTYDVLVKSSSPGLVSVVYWLPCRCLTPL